MLEKLANKHKIWVAMALNIGVPYSICEDIVQEMYLRLNRYVDDEQKIMYKDTGEVNHFYVWVTLRNMWNTYISKKKKGNIVLFSELPDPDSLMSFLRDDLEESEVIEEIGLAQRRMYDKIMDEVDSWDSWYNKKLFRIYYTTDIGLRQLSRETKISLTSLFNSCKNFREVIKDELGEDYEDLMNGDYNLI